MRRTYHCVEMAAITCYQSTWSHLLDLISFVKISCFIKKEMMLQFCKLENFLSLVYLCLFVCNFAAKLAFVPNLLAIVFAVKVSCQYFIHTDFQSFNGNCTTFTKGVSCVGK